MNVFWGIAVAMAAIASAFVCVPLLRGTKAARGPALLVLGVALPALAFGIYRLLAPATGVTSAFSHAELPAAPPGVERTKVASVDEMIAGLEARLARDAADAKGWLLLAQSYEHVGRTGEAEGAYQRAAALGLRNPDTPGAAARTDIDASSGLEPASIERLRARLADAPQDADAWVELARGYYSLRRYTDARTAFQHAVKLRPDDAQVWADYADTLAMAQDKRIDGAAIDAVEKALQLDPDHRKAIWLAGTAALQRADYAGALAHWEHLQALTPPESSDSRVIAANIAEAHQKAAGLTDAAGQPGVAGARIRGVVKLSETLQGSVSADDTVFVFARAVSGPPAPLAALRKRVADLPLSFELDDSMAMMPGLRLSSFPQVVVGARISRSGSATPAPGDISTISDAIHLADPVTVTLILGEPDAARL